MAATALAASRQATAEREADVRRLQAEAAAAAATLRERDACIGTLQSHMAALEAAAAQGRDERRALCGARDAAAEEVERLQV